MRVAFITGPRRTDVSYIQASVASAIDRGVVLAPEDVGVFSDSIEPPPGLRDGVRVFLRSAEYLASTTHTYLRITQNYHRALEWACEGCQLGCVCEDDVQFAHLWYEHVHQLAWQAIRESARFAITLIHFYEPQHFGAWSLPKIGERQLLKFQNVDTFYGQQAVVFPTALGRELLTRWRKSLAEYVSAGTSPPMIEVIDMGLKHHIMELGIPLYAVHPCLVQHVGDAGGVLERATPLRSAHYWSGNGPIPTR